MNRKQWIAVIAVVAMICVVAGASLSLNHGDEEKQTLVVETGADSAPFSYMIGDQYAGMETDLIRAVLDYMGYKVEFRTNSADVIQSLSQGKADIGASGFVIGGYGDSVIYSNPYAEANQVLVVQKGSEIKTIEDLDGKTISVIEGTVGAEYASTISDSVVVRETSVEAVSDVIDGDSVCIIVDSLTAESLTSDNDSLMSLDVITDAPISEYCFVFSTENEELAKRFDESLKRITDKGIFDLIWAHYEENGFSSTTASFYTTTGTLSVETSPDFPPFEYMYGTEYTGIDMDIMRAIAYDLNISLDMRNNNFDSIVLSVSQGKSDMGVSGFTIDEERKKQVLFSDPYYQIKQVVVVKQDSWIEDLEDVRGARISVQTGTSGAAYAGGVSSNIIYQKTYTEVVMDVINGKADCEIVDNTVAQAQVARNPGLKVLDILTDAETEYYGFIFAKGNQALCDIINESLAKLDEMGILDKITQYYVDNDYAEVPSYFSSAEVSEGGDSGDEGFWASLSDRFYNDFIKNDRYNFIFEGLKNTIIIAVVALMIGLALGAVVAMVRSTHDLTGKLKIANAICKVYTTVIRGTPVMVQLLIIYYVIFATSDLNSVLIASVAFGLNSGAYVAEVIRSGINAVPKGQMEACRSLGMSNRMAMTTVILPQALRNILPALGNESISLLKETSVAGYIGIMDLTRGADIIRGQTYDALLPIVVAGAIYLAIVMVLTYLVGRLEKRLNNAY